MSENWKKVKIKTEDDDDGQIGIDCNLPELDLARINSGVNPEQNRGTSLEHPANPMIGRTLRPDSSIGNEPAQHNVDGFRSSREGSMARHYNNESTNPEIKHEPHSPSYEDNLPTEVGNRSRHRRGKNKNRGPYVALIPKTEAECANCKGIRAPDGTLYDHKGHWLKDCTRNVTLRGTIFGCPWCNTTEHTYSSPLCTAPKTFKAAIRFLLADRHGKPMLDGDWNLMEMFGESLWNRQPLRRPQTAKFALSRRLQEQPIEDRVEDPFWDEIGASNPSTVNWEEISGQTARRAPNALPPLDRNIPMHVLQDPKGGRWIDPNTVAPVDIPEPPKTQAKNDKQGTAQDSKKSTNTGATGRVKEERKPWPSKNNKRERDRTPQDNQHAKRHLFRNPAPPTRESPAELELNRLEQKRLQLLQDEKDEKDEALRQQVLAAAEAQFEATQRRIELDRIEKQAEKARAALDQQFTSQARQNSQPHRDSSYRPTGNDTRHFKVEQRGRSQSMHRDSTNRSRGDERMYEEAREETFTENEPNLESRMSNASNRGGPGRGQSTWQARGYRGRGRGWDRGRGWRGGYRGDRGGGGRGGRGN